MRGGGAARAATAGRASVELLGSARSAEGGGGAWRSGGRLDSGEDEAEVAGGAEGSGSKLRRTSSTPSVREPPPLLPIPHAAAAASPAERRWSCFSRPGGAPWWR